MSPSDVLGYRPRFSVQLQKVNKHFKINEIQESYSLASFPVQRIAWHVRCNYKNVFTGVEIVFPQIYEEINDAGNAFCR